MNANERRKLIIDILSKSEEAISGSELAKRLNVSRQIIVQDIALLRASDYKIFSTHKGYILNKANEISRVFKVRHNDEQIADELYTIVDAGGRVLDVFVNHNMYGEIKANLHIATRKDVDDFVDQLIIGKISPLKILTDGYHYHTVVADSEEVLNRIAEELKKKKYLNV
ncbi:MAG: transcription repressor NadR [Clostridiales bacterium]|nr:transcription repressor NadR [Clostridiales bacterium]